MCKNRHRVAFFQKRAGYRDSPRRRARCGKPQPPLPKRAKGTNRAITSLPLELPPVWRFYDRRPPTTNDGARCFRFGRVIESAYFIAVVGKTNAVFPTVFQKFLSFLFVDIVLTDAFSFHRYRGPPPSRREVFRLLPLANLFYCETSLR